MTRRPTCSICQRTIADPAEGERHLITVGGLTMLAVVHTVCLDAVRGPVRARKPVEQEALW